MAHLQRSFARSNSSCSHRTHTHAHAHPCGMLLPALGQLSLDRFCYLGRFRYRSLSPTAQHPEKQCGLISEVVGRTFEQATRHFARLDNTPAEEEGSMQHAADSGRQWVNLWQCCESKRVSGLSIMCNATAHKISVPSLGQEELQNCTQTVPSRISFCLDQVPPAVGQTRRPSQPTD